MTRETIAKYPDYTRVTQAVADHLGVPPARVVLTNGLDPLPHLAVIDAARAMHALRERPDGRFARALP